MRKYILVLVSCFLVLTCSAFAKPVKSSQSERPIRAVRFDPAYYYGTGLSTQELALQLVNKWHRSGVNCIYFLAYSHVYGARYKTQYPHNLVEGFGREDLLGVMLPMAKARGMKVVAWFYDHQHKGAWNANPEWRVRERDGSYYKEFDTDFYLSVHHPEVRAYLQGFVTDLLTRYPTLDGIDITEPIVNWWGNRADFSPATVALFREEHPRASLESKTWQRFRSEGLTTHIREMIQTVHAMGKEVHLTTVFTASTSGELLSKQMFMEMTGFDLDAVLDLEDPPDYLNGELIWQFYADQHGEHFGPYWTKSGVKQAIKQVDGRVPFIAHVELSEIGGHQPTPRQLAASIRWCYQAGAKHIDFYHSRAADDLDAWEEIAGELLPLPLLTQDRLARMSTR